jgi:hypothetical protein
MIGIPRFASWLMRPVRLPLRIKKSDDFQWKLAGRSSDDGMIYGLGEHEKGRRASRGITSHGWQRAPGISGEGRGKSRGDFHAKLDDCFAEEECRLGFHPGWKRGVIIGGDPRRGGIRHYTEDGLLIGSFRSDPRYGTQPLDWPSGLLDAQLAVNSNRDPRDGILDVWTEDNFSQHLIWYRVDDRDIESFEGTLRSSNCPEE